MKRRGQEVKLALGIRHLGVSSFAARQLTEMSPMSGLVLRSKKMVRPSAVSAASGGRRRPNSSYTCLMGSISRGGVISIRDADVSLAL